MMEENRAVEYDTIEIAGHTVVAPWLSGYISDKLCRPLEEYFPEGSPELWFSWELEEQNRWVVERMFAGRCAFLGIPNPGEYVGCHHIIKRSIAHKAARVPWNCIPVMHSPNENHNIHGLLHPEGGLGLEIKHWDFWDRENGLAVLDMRNGGHRVPNDKLAFYELPSRGKSDAATEWIRLCLAAYRNHIKSGYELGALAAVGDEHAVVLGYKTVNACLNSYGMDTAPFKLGVRVVDNLPVHWDEGMDKFVALRFMDMISKMPEEKQKEFFDLAVQKCAPLDLDDPNDKRNPSVPDWMAAKKEATPQGNNPVECTVFDAGVTYEVTELTAEEISDMNKIVLKGKPIQH